MGCGDACPFIPGKRYIDWDLPDPAGQPLDTVRAIRDEIAIRVFQLATQLTLPQTANATGTVTVPPARPGSPECWSTSSWVTDSERLLG
jgi:hypothetical protein